MNLKIASCAASMVLLFGCTTISRALTENRLRAAQLHLGMTSHEVAQIMGTGIVYDRRSYQITNPWRSEAFTSKDGRSVEVLYYLIEEKNNAYYSVADDELAPVVLEKDRVVGLGWPFLQQNIERSESRIR